MIVLAYILAGLIGAILVTLGAGGSIVTLPVLVYAVGLDVHQAVGTSLLIVGVIAVVGTLLRRRSVSLRTGLLFGGAGMLGTWPGVWINHRIPSSVVLLGFAATMLIVAGLMMLGRDLDLPAQRPSTTRAMGVGFGVGAATGLFGVGGGFLIVPALSLLLDLGIVEAVATSLLVIALNSAAGLIGHSSYGTVEWELGLALAAAALVGAGLAFPLSKRLSGPTLERALAGLIAVVGATIAIDTVRRVLT